MKLKIAFAELLGLGLLPFCMAHAWKISGRPSIKPWPSGTPDSGPHRTQITCWAWEPLNAWYNNIEDGVSGQEAWIWDDSTPPALIRYVDTFPAWMPEWCIAFAWSVWRNGANQIKRPLR